MCGKKQESIGKNRQLSRFSSSDCTKKPHFAAKSSYLMKNIAEIGEKRKKALDFF
jgi:hypothetical protein